MAWAVPAALLFPTVAALNLGPFGSGALWGEDAVRAARSPDTVMSLHLMSDKGLGSKGAVCLDGSDAGFYFAPASTAEHADDWQIYFMGGGWCYDEIDCWNRSTMILGSNKDWPQTLSLSGMMSDNCTINPDFCNFNRVHINYCDGNSFAGDRAEPMNVTGPDGLAKPLYFRGRRVLDAVLETLLPMGLASAKNVLLTGCSAGGLATFLHADYVRDSLERAKVPFTKFKAVPMSGYFLMHDNIHGEHVYETQMRRVFDMSNATGGLNSKCIAAMKPQDRWRCNFAAYSFAHVEAPMFVINSALDSWQVECIYAAKLPAGFPKQNDTDNGKCSAFAELAQCVKDAEACNRSQMETMNHYLIDWDKDFRAVPSHTRTGNGAFVHSCLTHCEAQTAGGWTQISARGVTLQQAVSRWWASDGEVAATHSHDDHCLYHAEAAPHRCNPSCAPAALPESAAAGDPGARLIVV